MSHSNYRKEFLHHKIHKHVKNHVNSVRQKSDNHKKIYAFSVAFIVTSIVFMLWYFLSLPNILNSYQVNKLENERLDINPIEDVKDIFNAEVNIQQ